MRRSRSCLLAWYCILTGPAAAHDHWMSRQQFRDPVSGDWCCNEHDCQPLDSGQVHHVRGKVTVTIPYFGEDRRFTFTSRRILPSGDENYWACISTEATAHGRGVSLSMRCFFEPLGQ